MDSDSIFFLGFSAAAISALIMLICAGHDVPFNVKNAAMPMGLAVVGVILMTIGMLI